MKLQDLPSPYRELAEMRRTDESDFLTGAFQWALTPEGNDFWARVNISYTPPIPASSLKELAEWQKSKGEKVEPTQELKYEPLIGCKTDTEWLYHFAGQAMSSVKIDAGYAELIMGFPPPEGDSVGHYKWWREAEAKFCVIQAKALLTQLKKEVENV